MSILISFSVEDRFNQSIVENLGQTNFTEQDKENIFSLYTEIFYEFKNGSSIKDLKGLEEFDLGVIYPEFGTGNTGDQLLV